MKMPKKLLENLTDEFWDMRAKFKDAASANKENRNDLLWFDYPDYYDLPKRVSNRLSSDFVDSLQGDFFGEMNLIGLKAYKDFFQSKRKLGRTLLNIWKIYGLAE